MLDIVYQVRSIGWGGRGVAHPGLLAGDAARPSARVRITVKSLEEHLEFEAINELEN